MNQLLLKKSFLLVGLLLFAISCEKPFIEPVIYLIPANYMGYVYIFHNVPDGEPLKREGFSRVYEIPKDGIVRSKGQGIANAVIPKYFYVMPDGKREKINEYPSSSNDDTPENGADNIVGIFNPVRGNLSGSSVAKGGGQAVPMFNCEIRYEQFYVGTKSYLRSNHNLQKDLFEYVKEHPICP